MDCHSALVVDDEPAIRQATARALKARGFRCDMAADGQQALQMLLENDYRLVVTDLRMPEVNGHCVAVEALGKPDRAVVMVITGVMEERLERDLRARGVDDIFLKPVDYSVFAARAKQLVESTVAVHRVKPLDAQETPRVVPVSDHQRDASGSAMRTEAAQAGHPVKHPVIDLPSPTSDIDAMREANQHAITIRELDEAIGADPLVTGALSRLVDAVADQFRQRIDRIQQDLAIARPQELRWILPTLAFVIGTCVGGLLMMWAR